jgi:hypothetical protein
MVTTAVQDSPERRADLQHGRDGEGAGEDEHGRDPSVHQQHEARDDEEEGDPHGAHHSG